METKQKGQVLLRRFFRSKFVVLALWLTAAAMLALTAASCGGASDRSIPPTPTTQEDSTAQPSPTEAPPPTAPPTATPVPASEPGPTASPRPTATPEPVEYSKGGVRAINRSDARRELTEALINTSEWTKTDFRFKTVDLIGIRGGGPPKDGIRSIDDPQFESVESASQWLADWEPVQTVSIDGDHRAYPVQIMMFHELVNDVVGGEPVVVTY